MALCVGVVVAANLSRLNPVAAESRVLPLATGSLLAGVEVSPIRVVAWGAEWCHYCRKNKPELERLQKSGKYVIIYYDYDDNKDLAKQLNIKNLPTYLVVLDDKIVLRTTSISTLKAYKPPRN